jgi:hypothetical protein
MIRRNLSLCGIALLVQVGAAAAVSLDKEACDKLKAEQTQLEGAGARTNMAQGPEWAKGNLAPDKLAEIKRLIEVEELLMFRCGTGSRLVMPADSDSDDDDDSKKNGDKAPPAKEATKSAKAPEDKSENKNGAARKAGAPAKAAKAKQSAPADKK